MEEQEHAPLNYASALEELERIVKDLQNDAIPLQDLTQVVSRAARLLQFCKEQLRQTGEEIDKLFDF